MDNLLVVISGPSGGGKSTIIKELLSRNEQDYRRISTFTTRPKRPNEVDREQYHFITQERYDRLDGKGLLVAKNTVDGYLYGAPLIDMNAFENRGKFLIMDMGVSGAAELKGLYKNSVCIYIIPPTQERLLSQMGTRGYERFVRSKKQIKRVKDVCDWLVINDDLETAASQIQKIMHTIKEYAPNFDSVDEETMRFLYDRNFHNKQNIDFLDNFYHTKERTEEEFGE